MNVGSSSGQNDVIVAPNGEYVDPLACDGELITVENLEEMAERLRQWLNGRQFDLAHSRTYTDGLMTAELYEQAHLAEDIDPPVFHMQNGKELEEIYICVHTHEVQYYWLTVQPCYPGVAHPQRRRTDITFGERHIVIKCRSVGAIVPRPYGEPEVFPGSLVVYSFTDVT